MLNSLSRIIKFTATQFRNATDTTTKFFPNETNERLTYLFASVHSVQTYGLTQGLKHEDYVKDLSFVNWSGISR